MSNEHFVSDRHPVSCRSAIFEDDGTSAWMYLTEAHNVRPIADTWIHNSNQHSSEDSKPDRAVPPPAPSRYAVPAAVCEKSDEHRWTFKWDETGESVALLKDDQPIAFIVAGQKRGFSRMVLNDGPWDEYGVRTFSEESSRRYDRDSRVVERESDWQAAVATGPVLSKGVFRCLTFRLGAGSRFRYLRICRYRGNSRARTMQHRSDRPKYPIEIVHSHDPEWNYWHKFTDQLIDHR